MANLVKRWNKDGKVALCEASMLKQMKEAGFDFTECPIDVEVKVEEKVEDVVEPVKAPAKTRKPRTKKVEEKEVRPDIVL